MTNDCEFGESVDISNAGGRGLEKDKCSDLGRLESDDCS